MRRLLIVLALWLFALPAAAQFGGPGIDYKPPSSSATGDIDPSQMSSPDGSIVVGGVVGAATLTTDGTQVNFTAGAGDPPATCGIGDTHLKLGTGWYECTDDDPDTWERRVTFSLTSTSGMGFVVDEDDMVSDSATKVPTQQSVKAYVDASAGSFDPGTALDLYEECTSGNTTAGGIGNLGMTFTAIGAGTFGANVAVADTPMHPGLCYTLAHATNDDSGGQITMTNAAAGASMAYSFGASGSGAWALDYVVLTPASLTDRGLYIGLLGGGTPTYNGLVAARFDTDRGDTTWGFVICDSTTTGCQEAGDATNQNYVASTITPSAATAYRVRIEKCVSCGPAGVEMISMRINNETAKTFCSASCDDTLANRPAANSSLVAGASFFTRAANTTAIVMGQLDYMHLTITGLTRY